MAAVRRLAHRAFLHETVRVRSQLAGAPMQRLNAVLRRSLAQDLCLHFGQLAAM